MRFRTFLMLLFVLLAPATTLAATAPKPDEASLLMAWEAAQRGDPKTEIFDRVEPGRYRFKTTRFPYDGEIVVYNVVIDDVGNDDWVRGVVEAGLTNVDEMFQKRYSYSFSSWEERNTFYYFPRLQRWTELYEHIPAQPISNTVNNKSSSLSELLSLANPVVFWVLLAFLFGITIRHRRRYMVKQDEALSGVRQSLQLQEQSLALQEETNRLLRALLQESGGVTNEDTPDSTER